MTLKVSESIDEFVSGLPKEVKVMFQKVRATFRTVLQDAEEANKYARPTFALNGKNLAHFVAFNNSTGFYPAPACIESFQKELSTYKQRRGAAQFPLDQSMPLKRITEMVKCNMQQ
jgi:uncharacterized protein YdhG (YjbR/CyaY superfamily)